MTWKVDAAWAVAGSSGVTRRSPCGRSWQASRTSGAAPTRCNTFTSSGAGGGIASFGPFFAAAVALELCFAFIGSGLSALDSTGAGLGAGFGSPGQIGRLLLQNFLLPFEASSYLLLVAAVGAVVLARRRRGLEVGGALEEGGP